MGRHEGSQYTKDEAEGMIPPVARLVALGAVDLVIALDRYPLDSGEIERRLWALTGEVGHMSKLFHTLWKAQALEQLKVKRTVKSPPPLKRGNTF